MMRNKFKIFISMMSVVALLGINDFVSVGAETTNEVDEFLLNAGMPEELIEAYDDDIKEYMVIDMKASGGNAFQYVEMDSEDMYGTRITL